MLIVTQMSKKLTEDVNTDRDVKKLTEDVSSYRDVKKLIKMYM